MKTFLKVDIGIQVLFYLIGGIGLAILLFDFEPHMFFYGFVGLGGWQLLSAATIMLVTLSGAERGWYFISALVYVFASLILFWVYPLYIIGAYAFSVWYFRISYAHLKRLENVSTSFWDLA